MYKSNKRLSGFNSPVLTGPKKSKISAETSSSASLSPVQATTSEEINNNNNDDDDGGEELTELKKELNDLKKELNQKEEMLRKLKLVKMYRDKKDFKNLPDLTEKWKNCCQKALQDLHMLLPDPRPSMLQLLQNLQIEPLLLGYNVEEDSFDT
ncbi:hypothetical protein HELRODRAFT_184679 [Helobdella robusta]|uniref:Swi5-dependent recombination DNA repair protein 1 homolog n=1 Tax=Helobdella robusta TaxID=6412 RepID=T1FLR2_HELRO|nr:hypothetical protein HELRODRAFT_184679 [Helobdella robusta]ESO06731.1 hypothetical protein HELRODRAFT_184679 [Helobdella robusta]